MNAPRLVATPLPPRDPKPHREHVAQNHTHSGCREPSRTTEAPASGEPHREIAFRGVQDKRDDAGDDAGRARHIRRADVAASQSPDIAAARGQDNQQPAKGIEPSA